MIYNHVAFLESGLLFVVDGGSGLNKARRKYQVHDKKNRKAIRVRCLFTSGRNIEKGTWRQFSQGHRSLSSLRDAKDTTEAKVISDRLESVLRNLNLSALQSHLEAKDDLLVIHELKIIHHIKKRILQLPIR